VSKSQKDSETSSNRISLTAEEISAVVNRTISVAFPAELLIHISQSSFNTELLYLDRWRHERKVRQRLYDWIKGLVYEKKVLRKNLADGTQMISDYARKVESLNILVAKLEQEKVQLAEEVVAIQSRLSEHHLELEKQVAKEKAFWEAKLEIWQKAWIDDIKVWNRSTLDTTRRR
jgi:hypothetical protein